MATKIIPRKNIAATDAIAKLPKNSDDIPFAVSTHESTASDIWLSDAWESIGISVVVSTHDPWMSDMRLDVV